MNRGVLTPLRAWANVLREILEWWRGELRDLGQALLRQLPSRKSPELLLRVSAVSISVEQSEGAGSRVVGTVPIGADGAWPEELPGLSPALRGARTAIALPESELFSCEFELPLAAERHLSAVLGLQLERSLPLPLDQVLTDRQIISRDRQRETLRVRAVVAHRDFVEALRERVLGWGLVPVSAGLIGVDGSPQFNLLKRRRDPVRWSPTPFDLNLLKVAGIAASVLVVLIGVQWTRERLTVNAASADLQAQAARIEQARQSVVERAKPLLALQSIGASSAAPELLANLSAAVPASAWFTHVDLTTPVNSPGTIKLTGHVTSQEEVVAALGTTPGVRNLKTSSAFNGEILGSEQVEFVGEFVPVSAGVL